MKDIVLAEVTPTSDPMYKCKANAESASASGLWPLVAGDTIRNLLRMYDQEFGVLPPRRMPCNPPRSMKVKSKQDGDEHSITKMNVSRTMW